MPVKAVLDSLDGVDDAIAGLYVEQDGSYVLDADVDNHPKVRGLVTTLRKYKEVDPDAGSLKRRMAKLSEMEAFGGLEKSPDEIREALDELETLRASGGNNAKLDELKATLEAQWDRKVKAAQRAGETAAAEKDKEIGRLSAFVEKLTLHNALDEALSRVGGTGVIPETREAVRALLLSRNPKVVKDGDDYRAVFETDTGDLSPEQYVEAWSRRDEAAPFMPASGNQGSGAGGGKGTGGGSRRVNPWKDETRNVSEQMRLIRENRRLAEQLAAEAGKSLPKMAA